MKKILNALFIMFMFIGTNTMLIMLQSPAAVFIIMNSLLLLILAQMIQIMFEE